MKATITGKLEAIPFYREASFIRESLSAENRTCEMSCSSETPVERYFGMEILDHSPECVDLSRMQAGAPLLVGHNMDDQVGVVESCSIVDRKLRAVVRFSKSERGEEIWQDVQDGIRRSVSIGYRVEKVVTEEDASGVETCRVVRWTPYETSLVPCPADASVGVGRSQTSTPNIISVMPEIATTPNPATATATKDAATILALGRQFNALDEAQAALEKGTPVDEFRATILGKLAARSQPVTPTSAEIGMTPKEVRQWSLIRAINRLADQKPLDGIEREASDAVAKMCKREAGGFFIPHEVAMHKRDLDASGTATLGGNTIQTNVLGSSLIELLRNQMVTNMLGARQLTGLIGDVAIPSGASGATAYWVDENEQTTSSNPTFGQVGLTPHRLSGVTAISKRLLAQSSIDVEGYVRQDLALVLAIATDLAVLAGTGNNGQPTGILATSNVGSVTFGAAATYAKVIEFETALATSNALMGSLAYVVSPATRAKWKAAPRIGSTFPSFLWENDMVNGYKAVATSQMTGTTHKVIFGNWNDVIVGSWAGLDVIVDPYTLADKHQIKVTVNQLVDVAVRHPGSFAISADSGAQ